MNICSKAFSLLSYLGLEEAWRTLLAYFLWLVCQDLYLHSLEDLLGDTYIF